MINPLFMSTLFPSSGLFLHFYGVSKYKNIRQGFLLGLKGYFPIQLEAPLPCVLYPLSRNTDKPKDELFYPKVRLKTFDNFGKMTDEIMVDVAAYGGYQ